MSAMHARAFADAERRSLPALVSSERYPDDLKVPLLVVRVRAAELAAGELFQGDLRVRVKYGKQGASARCETAIDSPSIALRAAATQDALCVFLWSKERQPVLRVSLARGAWPCGAGAPKAELSLAGLSQHAYVDEQVLPIYRSARDWLGRETQVPEEVGSVSLEVRRGFIPLGVLRQRVGAWGAGRCHGGYVVDTAEEASGLMRELSDEEGRRVRAR